MADTTRTILAVDDDVDLLLQLKLQLEAKGFAVETAESRAEAVTKLPQVKPDLAIVDLMMESMDDGFTLCRDIKKFNAALPVIMVTGVTRETGLAFEVDSEDDRMWLKADAVLAKPIRFEQLEREIVRLMGD